MSSTRRSVATILVLLFTIAFTAGCGSDSDSSSDRPSTEEGQTSADPPDSDGSEWTDENAPWRSDDVELSAAAAGLKAGLMAEDVEVEGTTVHVYLEDGKWVPGACTLARGVLPDGATAVIHQDGEETVC